MAGTDQGAYAHPPGPADASASRPLRPSRVVAVVGLALLLFAPPISHIRHEHAPSLSTIVTLSIVVVLLALFVYLGLAGGEPSRSPRFWIELAVLYVLGVALVLYGGPEWLVALTLVAAISGLRCDKRIATVLAVGCAATVLTLAYTYHEPPGHSAIIILLTVVMALFSHGSGRRLQTISELRETRAHLARIAVQEERLRIARDLHDLLGHSLSVITVKSELVERTLRDDPAYAEREIAEVGAIARDSLNEVRQAVSGYRQPGLAAEIAAAQRALASAGIDCELDTPEEPALPPACEGALAWAVREGVTNVVRHSGATHCAIRVTADEQNVVVEVEDDGVAATAPESMEGTNDTPVVFGSGLLGLSERAAATGGEMRLFRVPPGGGAASARLRLTMTVPRTHPRNRTVQETEAI